MFSVFITLELVLAERRVLAEWTLEELKQKLEPVTGVRPADMHLAVYHSVGEAVAVEAPDSALVGSVGIEAQLRIHVSDTRPDLELSQVAADWKADRSEEAFVLLEQQYEQRADLVLAWKKQQQLGRFDPGYSQRAEAAVQQQQAAAAALVVGLRCRVGEVRVGYVRYVGAVPEIAGGVWCGVEFDEPLGKNNGSVKGTVYFECRPCHGSFVRPAAVEVGDFSAPSLLDEDEM